MLPQSCLPPPKKIKRYILLSIQGSSVLHFFPSSSTSSGILWQVTHVCEVALLKHIFIVVFKVWKWNNCLFWPRKFQQFLIEQNLHFVLFQGRLDLITVVKHEHQVCGIRDDSATAKFPIHLLVVVTCFKRLIVLEITHESKERLKGLCMTDLEDRRWRNSPWTRKPNEKNQSS